MITNGKGKKDVFINDQVTPPIQYYLMREDKSDITLTASVNPEDTVISVSAGHGFTGEGEYIVIFDNCRFIQAKVKSVSDDDITLFVPSSYSFSLESVVIRGIIDLSINGSSTNQEFVMNFRRCNIPIDIDLFITNINHATEGDDSKFGNLAGLTNGLVVRKQNDVIQGLGVYFKNSDFREYGGEVEYTDKAGAGVFGTFVKTDMRDSYGIVIRVRPDKNEIIKAIVRDDLSSLNVMRIAVTGQYTQGEL